MNNNTKYYAVRMGHKEGIYTTWEECKNATYGFKNPVFRKFNSFEEAQSFMDNKPFKVINVNHQKLNNDNKQEKKINYSTDKYLSRYREYIKSDNFNIDYKYPIKDWNVFNDEYFIFTDGSFKKNESTTSSGLGVFMGINSINIKEQYEDKTNNQCELDSVRMVFEIILKNKDSIIKNNKKINIVSDSEYTINSLTLWIKKWKLNNWLTANGKPVKNKDIIEKIDECMYKIKVINSELETYRKIKIKFVHVKSHQKPNETDKYQLFLWQGNLIADALAQNKI